MELGKGSMQMRASGSCQTESNRITVKYSALHNGEVGGVQFLATLDICSCNEPNHSKCTA